MIENHEQCYPQEIVNSKRVRNTEKIELQAKLKTKITKEKVEKAIKHLIKTKSSINFSAIATEAKVSKAFLYKDILIREQIVTLRCQQQGLDSPKQMKVKMSTANKDALLGVKSKRIAQLEEENKKLKKELATLRGIKYWD